MASTATVARLGLALHASIPPALFSVLMNAIVSNKTYRPLKLVGRILPTNLKTQLRRVYVFANGVFVVGVLGFLNWNCPSTDFTTNECLPALSIVSVVLLLLLWVDRGTLAFLDALGTNPTFVTRVARGACCAGFLMAISEHDSSSMLFLTLALTNRHSGSITLASRLRAIDCVVRIGVSISAMHAIYRRKESRRLAALLLACAIHSR